MQIKFNFKNFEPSDHLREYAHSRFEKLSNILLVKTILNYRLILK